MAKRIYKPKSADIVSSIAQFTAPALPIDRAIAIYYRQSTNTQIGNVSTEMQQVDLPKLIEQYGWSKELIIPFFQDEGVSGRTNIDEREGMRKLVDAILKREIGAVAVYSEDRLFRDPYGINPGSFMKACHDNNVILVTPGYIYDFSRSMDRKIFKERTERAADFLEVNIYGRAHPAKMRLMNSGRWAGGSIPIGFIVDDRKNLDKGISNPEYRRYVVFEPYAKVIRAYFDLFNRNNGNLRLTARQIVEQGLFYPDFDDPEILAQVPREYRFLKPHSMKKDPPYYATRYSLADILSNAAYAGHWTVKNSVVMQDTHMAIVSNDVFSQAFNRLSPVTLDGEENPHYNPLFATYQNRSNKQRNTPEPICKGLVVSQTSGGKWRRAHIYWVNKYEHYTYELTDYPHENLLWAKRSDWLDEEVVRLLKQKLEQTFSDDAWNLAIDKFDSQYATDQRVIKYQLDAIAEEMETMVTNIGKVRNARIISDLERKYEAREMEHARLTSKLNESTAQQQQRDRLVRLRKNFTEAVRLWDTLNRDELREILIAFVERIVVSPQSKHSIKVDVCWLDGNKDFFYLASRTRNQLTWLPSEEELLMRLIDSNSSQLIIASAFPKRKWHLIRNKVYSMRGKGSLQVAPKLITDHESYNDYLMRIGNNHLLPKAGNAERWHPDQVAKLCLLFDQGADQLALMAEFPRRNWDAIRRKITENRGKDAKIIGGRKASRWETIDQYRARVAAVENNDHEHDLGEMSESNSVSGDVA